jgi:starvation-inducible outer membrane lipoprotein
MKRRISYLKIFLLGIVLIELTSCIALPPRQNISNDYSNNNMSQIEALSREEYDVLRATNGSAATSRFYLFIFPMGKHKTNSELYQNAYYDAVDNLPNADALILPRQHIKKFVLPLILINYSRREVTVSGVGISVKDKIMENLDLDVPFMIANDYHLKTTFKNNEPGIPNKITSQRDFDMMFEKSTTNDENIKPTSIDFSKQYVIAVVNKGSKNNSVINANYLKVKGDEITLYCELIKGEKRPEKSQPFIILVIDKKYQGNVRLKEVKG